MTSTNPHLIDGAEIVLPCPELEPTLRFFRELGFRLDVIYPADSPEVAVISGFGIRLRLSARAVGPAGVLRLLCRDVALAEPRLRPNVAPNGTRLEWVDTAAPRTPSGDEPSLIITRSSGDQGFRTGRAGMLYRDLVPGRQGGSFIASHIRILGGGPVDDAPHFHDIRFQVIYCYRGWVRVVYEDQGPPFVLAEGDCVLQPPKIRHRVLECSPGLEVIECAGPAEHETVLDHEITLPTGRLSPERVFGGQRFVRHVAESAGWGRSEDGTFDIRDFRLGTATQGVVSGRVVRATAGTVHCGRNNQGSSHFLFALDGCLTLHVEGREPGELLEGDACFLPAGAAQKLESTGQGFEILEITIQN